MRKALLAQWQLDELASLYGCSERTIERTVRAMGVKWRWEVM